jgi:histone deacetylase complex regulatory component SIN3
MKKRVDEIQTFHNSASRVASSTTRILTPPQHNNSPNSTPGQFQILNVLRDASAANVSTPTQSIQYTYTPSAISTTANIQKNNITQPAQNQTVHVINTGVNLTNPTSRPKTASGAGNITPTPLASGGNNNNAIPVQNVTGQNFPRLKVEDALSYLDQVSFYL